MAIHTFVVCYKLEMGMEMESKLKYKCPKKNFAAYIEPHTRILLWLCCVLYCSVPRLGTTDMHAHRLAFSAWTIAIVIILCAAVTGWVYLLSVDRFSR